MTLSTTLDVGLNTNWDLKSLQWTADAGFRSCRIGWEPQWSFDQLLHVIEDARSVGLDVHLGCLPQHDAGHPGSYDDPAMGPFVDKCARLNIASIEFFNEGNHFPFIQVTNGPAWADAQVKMLRIAKAAALQAGKPNLKYCLAGLSPESGDRDPLAFLEAALKHNPGLRNFSAFGAHPYQFHWLPTTMAAWNPVYQLDALAALWAKYGKATMPFWITEFGAPTGGNEGKFPDEPYRYDEVSQKKWLINYMKAFAMSKAKIQKIMWYNQQDGDSGTGAVWETYAGLMRRDGTDKAASEVMRGIAWSHR